MTRKDLMELGCIIRRQFGPPFLQEGEVTAAYNDSQGTLEIRIARRDIEIDENLKVVGSGTWIARPIRVASPEGKAGISRRAGNKVKAKARRKKK